MLVLVAEATVVSVIQNIKKLDYLDSLKFVTTSIQIKIIAENLGLKVFDEGLTEGLECSHRWSRSG